MTPAQINPNTTEWNILRFSAMKGKHPVKPASLVLDLLFKRAKDFQTMLDDAYRSPILLCDRIIRAVKDEVSMFP